MAREPRRLAFDEAFTRVSMTSRVPLYAQVISQIEDAIRRGLVVVGDTLPTEQQFCSGFGVARTTLRRAMEDLEARSIISRTQGRGTLVESNPTIDYRPETSHAIFDLITANQRQPRTIVQAFDPIISDDAVATLTGFPVGTPLLHVVRDRYADDAPFVTLATYLLPAAMCFDRKDLATKSMDAVLRANGWVTDRVEYEIRAIPLNERIGSFMQLPAGTPALQEHRACYREGKLFSVTENTYHPTNYRLGGVVDQR